MAGVVAGVVGYLAKARPRPMPAVDRPIVILSGALEALQSSFLDQHNNERTQPAPVPEDTPCHN